MNVAMGYATRYNQIVVRRSTSILVLPGAFSKTLNSKTSVSLLLNHFENQYVGSTRNILELWDDGYTGLAFGVSSIPDTEHGQNLRYMAKADYDSVSIGFDYLNAHKVTRTINGTDVVCIVSADLEEVSIMSGYNGGACKKSFVAYGNFDSLAEECRSGRLLREGAAVEFRRAVRRYEIARFAEAQKSTSLR